MSGQEAFVRYLVVAAVGALAAGAASAALVETTTPSVSVAFDSQLSTAALIYDADFYGANEGRLVLLATGSSLRGPGVPGSNGVPGTAPSQFYLTGSDQLRDLVVSIRINNQTGAFVSGTVSVPPDNQAAGSADAWRYSGFITAFGAAESTGGSANTFDARWFADAYDFSDVASNAALGIPGAPQTCSAGAGRCGYGYLRFSTANIGFLGGAGSGVNFGTDWVRGAGLSGPNSQLGSYDDNIAASAFQAQSVAADVFVTPVPLPGGLLLAAAGLASLLPWLRRRPRA